MIETLVSLFFAHVMVEFVFLPRLGKERLSQPLRFICHFAALLGLGTMALGRFDPVTLWLALVLPVIQLGFAPAPLRLGAFVFEQTAKMAGVILAAHWMGDVWAQGHWAQRPELLTLAILIAAVIVATRVGGSVVGLLMRPFDQASPDGLVGGGRVIGVLERGMILLLLLIDQPESVGLLIAAKSVLRFNAVRDDRAASEYVIIGTLASFAWALFVASLTKIVLDQLPGLGIATLFA